MRARRLARATLLLLLLLATLPAVGQEKREVPDYDGRPPPGTSAGEALLWVPRVLLFPLYVVSEYVVRRPLGALITTAEKNDWPIWLYETFTFGEEHQAGIYPIGYVDFGFRPSIGLRGFWKDAPVEGNTLRLSVATGGRAWLLATASTEYELSDNDALGLRVAFLRRPDSLFHGLGPRSLDEDATRYGSDRWEVAGAFERKLGVREESGVRLALGVRHYAFRDDTCCGDPALAEQAGPGALPAPPGLGARYTTPFAAVGLTLDSRPERPAAQHGALLQLRAEHALRSLDGRNEGWVRYGGRAEGFLDLTSEARVVSLGVHAQFVDPVGREPVPFNELAGAEGMGPLVAFRPGRLHDRSMAALALRYTWPVWAAADGELMLAAGNVFGEHLSGLEPGLLRLNASLALISPDTGEGKLPIELTVGVGTEPLEDGLRFSSLRILFGAAL